MRREKWFYGLLMAVLGTALLATPVLAQSLRGDISGKVTDTSGSALPGVTVTLISDQGEQMQVTDESGRFIFRSVAAGVHRVKFSLEGFQTIEQENVHLSISGKASLEVEMTSNFTEELVVTSERPVVDVATTEQGVNMDESFFRELPTQRNYASVASVTPGAQADASGQTFYGSSGAENSFYIDGINTTGIELGQQGKTLNFEFIQEVQVKTGGYQAQYGRATGALINVITKSGGNEYSGDVFGYHDSDSLQSDLSGEAAEGAVSGTVQQTGFDRSDFGFGLGGFIKKDRMWFFGSYDKITNDRTLASLEDFSLYVPGAASLGQEFPDDIETDQWAGKLTLAASTKHSFTLSAFGDPTTREGAGGASLAAPPSHYLTTLETGGTDAALSYDGVLTSNFLVYGRGSKHKEKSITTGEGTDLVGFIDNTDPLGDGTVTWGWAGNPNPSGIGFYQDQHFGRDQFNIDASYFLDAGGSHEFKLGYEFEDISVENANLNSGGERIYRFNCSPSRCFDDQEYYYRHRYFVTDKIDPTTATAADVNNPLVVDTKAENEAVYFQDRWALSSNLTLNLGVRYEKQDLFNAFGEVSASIGDPVSPRIGLTWDPTSQGKAKIYAYYGTFRESIPMDIVIRSFGGEISIFAYNYSQNPGDYAGLPTDLIGRRSSTLGGGISRVDPNTEGQYLEEINVGGEYEIAKNLSLGLKYLRRELKSVIEDALSADGDYFIGNPGDGLMAGTYDLGYAYGYNETLHLLDKPTREFTGVELTLRKNLSNNYQYLASIVWSELEGSYDGTFQASTGQLDPNLNSAFDYYDFSVNNYGLLSNDREWQAKFDGVYYTNIGLVIGASAWWRTGTPVTAMGYSGAYQNWEYYLSERGAFGRVDDQYEMDLHLGYPLKMSNGDRTVHLLLDVFNLLDAQTETSRDIRYTTADEVYQPIDWVTGAIRTITPEMAASDPDNFGPTNPAFNTANAWTAPRVIRLGVRFSF